MATVHCDRNLHDDGFEDDDVFRDPLELADAEYSDVSRAEADASEHEPDRPAAPAAAPAAPPAPAAPAAGPRWPLIAGGLALVAAAAAAALWAAAG